MYVKEGSLRPWNTGSVSDVLRGVNKIWLLFLKWWSCDEIIHWYSAILNVWQCSVKFLLNAEISSFCCESSLQGRTLHPEDQKLSLDKLDKISNESEMESQVQYADSSVQLFHHTILLYNIINSQLIFITRAYNVQTNSKYGTKFFITHGYI